MGVKIGVVNATHKHFLAIEVLTRIQHQGGEFIDHVRRAPPRSRGNPCRHLEQDAVLLVEFLIA
jgi:hypothetical protein